VGYSNIGRLEIGDVLSLNDEHRYVITRIGRYSSHEELLGQEDAARIAPGTARSDLLDALRSTYPPEKEALGVIALEIEPAGDSEDGASELPSAHRVPKNLVGDRDSDRRCRGG
jgi:ASC-1-like (ASCH) protein